jgi:glycerate kinase
MRRSEIRSVLIAPDSFKGSLSSREAGEAIAAGVLGVLPDATVRIHPISDGGEGFVEILAPHLGGRIVTTTVSGPLGGTVTGAKWAVCRGGELALIETAQAAGLLLVPPSERDPKRSSTRGVGELILAACGAGVREIVVGLGGSATNDGGAGMAEALGVRFLDASGMALGPGGGSLPSLASIDLSHLDPAVARVGFTGVCDVAVPLLGPRGASVLFSPQKGALRGDIPLLEKGLARLADVIQETSGIDIREIPGSGAAGGLGGGLAAFCGALLRPGIDLVLELTLFDDALKQADLVITGEGKMDAQSRQGKAVSGILRRSNALGKPVIAVVGSDERIDRGPEEEFLAVASLVDGSVAVEEAMRDAGALLRMRTSDLLGSILE